MHGLISYLEENPPPHAPEPLFHEMSHGEGFLEFLHDRVNQQGFYLLDEPEAPLSFTASLSLVSTLTELVTAGSQLVVATHSPVLAATPGATILEVGEWGLRETTWELELVGSWRRLLADPECNCTASAGSVPGSTASVRNSLRLRNGRLGSLAVCSGQPTLISSPSCGSPEVRQNRDVDHVQECDVVFS
jgi:hypothetical protein